MDIDARVPDKLKAKIWNNEFVDFSLLMSNHASNKFQLAIRNLGGSNPPNIFLEPINRNQKIVNTGIWLQVFTFLWQATLANSQLKPLVS